jgi:hypothetical protein
MTLLATTLALGCCRSVSVTKLVVRALERGAWSVEPRIGKVGGWMGKLLDRDGGEVESIVFSWI